MVSHNQNFHGVHARYVSAHSIEFIVRGFDIMCSTRIDGLFIPEACIRSPFIEGPIEDFASHVV